MGVTLKEKMTKWIITRQLWISKNIVQVMEKKIANTGKDLSAKKTGRWKNDFESRAMQFRINRQTREWRLNNVVLVDKLRTVLEKITWIVVQQQNKDITGSKTSKLKVKQVILESDKKLFFRDEWKI